MSWSTPGQRLRDWPLRALALVVVALGVFPFAEWMGLADPQIWWIRACYAWAFWVPLIVLIALVIARLWPAGCEHLATRVRGALLALSPVTFSIVAAALTMSLALMFSRVMFDTQPVTIDELSQLWQARLLASGHLFARAELHPEFFSTMQTVVVGDRWFTHFPLGGPAVQAPGVWLHAAWLTNPLLAGLATIAVYRFVAAIDSEARARLTTLLVISSPLVLIIAASRLDHVATLLFAWTALALLPRWRRATTDRDATWPAIGTGLALGAAAMVRPYDGAMLIIVVVAFQLHAAWRRPALRRSLAPEALALTLLISILLANNRALTGHPLVFGYDVLDGPEHAPGFHMSPLGFEHTPATGLFRISVYLMRLNAALLGWPIPVMVIIAAAMVLWRPVTAWDRLMTGYVAATLAGYWYYWGDGSFHGPRFLFEVAPIFILFAARFPSAARERMKHSVLRTALLLVIPLCVGAAWFLPATTLQPYSAVNQTFLSSESNTATTRLVQAVKENHFEHALVFVSDGWHARLSARLRALGMAPFRAQIIVGNFNTCTIQRRLDEVEREGLPVTAAERRIGAMAYEPIDAVPVPDLSALEQIALPSKGPLPHWCSWEMLHHRSYGIDMARLLPEMSVDSLGRLDGDVIYARDFGSRNELLRDRFGDRSWYTARVEERNGGLAIVIAPYRPDPPPSDR